MNHLTHQAHVAQQSRREKLRIPGTIHTDSSHLDSSSDHSVGFASQVQELQEGVQQRNQSDQEEPLSGILRGYSRPSNQISTNEMLSAYNSQSMSSDSYNFATGAELLAAQPKPGTYFCASAEMGSQTPVTTNTNFPGQPFVSEGYVSQRNWFSKGGNWEILNSQVARDSLNSMYIGATQGIPVHTSSGASQNVMAATLLLGALQSGRPDSSSKDGSIAQCSLLGTNVSPEAMQVYLMDNGPDGNVGMSIAGDMLWRGPPNAASLNPVLSGGQAHQNLLEIAFPSTQPGSGTDKSLGDGSVPCAEVPSPRAAYDHNTLRSGDELLFLPLSVDTRSMTHLNDQVTIAKKSDQESYPETESNIRQNFFSTFSSHQQQLLQAGLENRYTESPLAGNAYGQCLNLSLSSKRPLSLSDHNFDARIHSEGDNSITSQIDAKTLRHIPIETSSLSGFHSSRNEDYLRAIQDNLGDSRQFHLEHGSHAGTTSFTFLSRSKYFKVAQQLLDEVCSVRKEIMKNNSPKYLNVHAWKSQKHEHMEFCSADVAMQDSSCKDHTRNSEAMHSCLEEKLSGTSSANFTDGPSALSLEERKDCETRKGRLLVMLQEVDRRYAIYSDQMHALVASFDSILGNGAAIPYTSLAMQAMSRYFRCLRDAISRQIQLVCKALGEEEVGRQLTNRGGISRLRYVDQQIRQQRSFQHMGILQQHAWRPQRGLPERSVSVLRAWLFEHFLHPYPKDADKVMLARQTGLTRSQVSNWFINARVRLWKPMVEEMYQEEARDQEIEAPEKQQVDRENSNSDGITDTGRVDKTCKSENIVGLDNKIAPEGAADLQVFLEVDGLSSEFYPGNMSSIRNETMKVGAGYKAQVFEESNPDGSSPVQMKKLRTGISTSSNQILNPNKEVLIKSDEVHSDLYCDSEHPNNFPARQSDQRLYSIPFNGGLVNNNSGTMIAYEDGGLNRTFPSMYPANAVSLTLGLRHCDNAQLSTAQQSYLLGDHNMSEKDSYCTNIFEGAGVPIADHQNIEYPNSKHVGMQMLHDFVA